MKIRAAFALIWVFAALINLNTISNTHAAYIPSPSSKGKWQQQRPLKRLCPRQCLCLPQTYVHVSAYVSTRAYVYASAYVSTRACVHVSAYVFTLAWSPPVPMYPPETVSMSCICYVLSLPRFTC